MLDLGSNRDSYIQTLFNLWLQTETGDHSHAIPDPFFGVYICIKWRQNVDWAEFLYHNRILLDFWNRDLKSLKKRIILSEKALSWVNFLFSFYLNRCLYEGCPNYLTRLNYNCTSTIKILLLSVCLGLFMIFLVSLKSRHATQFSRQD